MAPSCRISVVIPCHNGGRSIDRCLSAAALSRHPSFEIIMVDDGSRDDSAAIAGRHPCRLLRFPEKRGAAAARNAGAQAAAGEFIFFTDADCLLLPDTLARAEEAARTSGEKTIIGGTYTPLPADADFFSRFQSLFIHYSELKKKNAPDYVATHAMLIKAADFRRSGGFCEEFLPILEDVEFSHRIQRKGFRLQMAPEVMVRHIFNFSLPGSLKNGFVKSRFWVAYSRANHDLLNDSGTASHELKVNVAAFCTLLTGLFAFAAHPGPATGAVIVLALLTSLFFSRRLLRLFFERGGPGFAILAWSYFALVYPLCVACGALVGLLTPLDPRPR